jgi:23S rRNA (guanosine2251-2'-O)-methyltransferase
MRDNYRRKEKDEDFVFGIHPVLEALKAGKPFEKLLLQTPFESAGIKEIIKLSKENTIEYKSVPAVVLDRLTTKNHQGVIAYLSPVEFYDLEEIVTSVFEKGKDPLILILDKITDVRNFGAIARTAECFGVDAILVPNQGGARIGSDAIKTSAGALLKIPICKSANLKLSLLLLQQLGFKIGAATEKSTSICYQQDLSGPLALIMGSEELGVSKEYLKLSSHALRIPLVGEIASLNVSVAAGILLYEIHKQRTI